MNLQMMTYIESENEFSRASQRGFWEVVRSFFTHQNAHLLSFNAVVSKLGLDKTADRGLQDIPLKRVVGSAGRHRDFTRHFLPRIHDKKSKERWRTIYTLAVTGRGFPPIQVYKVGQVYFVADGHHRVSVARYLNWKTIQAYVTEIPLDVSNEAEFFRCFGWREEAKLYN